MVKKRLYRYFKEEYKMIIGQVIETFSATKDNIGLPRPKVESLNLIEKYGIEFD